MSDITELFEREQSAYMSLRELHVPEWGLTVYARSRFSIESMKPIRALAEDGDPQTMVEVLYRNALDENGTRLFTGDQKHKIARFFDPDVVVRVGGWIMSNTQADEENEEPRRESSSSFSVIDGAELPRKSNGL